ncbi:hypothetical protein DRO59_07110 [Candidatus Bathyarchaeota archaeon]|nr:MAG: hypothetical protein DRO59_07110 [Candidatus Bathyarchaeota archaeon]
MSKSKVKEGWGFPLNSRKAHYFVNGRSLCGKWLFFGELEQGNDGSPDNCAVCKKLLQKRKRRLSGNA